MEFEECCDLCTGSSSAAPELFADRCTQGSVGFSSLAICNKYTKSGSDHWYCGEPIEYLNESSGQEPVTSGTEHLNFDPFKNCSNTPADVEAAFAMAKTKASSFTKSLTKNEIETNIAQWTSSERATVFGPAMKDMAKILMSGPTVTAENAAPASLGADSGSWDKPFIKMKDLKDMNCQTCAAMVNYARLNADLIANGGKFYINKAYVYPGNSLSFGGSGSAWITNTENHATITATTEGTLMIHEVDNTGTIVATGIKGAVLSKVQNSGTVTLTDVIGNGVDITNSVGATLNVLGNSNVRITFAEAKGTITFASTVSGTVDVPLADASNVDVSGASGLTKTCDGGACSSGTSPPPSSGTSPSPSSGTSPSPNSSIPGNSLSYIENSTSRETICGVVAVMAVLAFSKHLAW